MVSVEEIHVVSGIRSRKVVWRQVCLNAHKGGRIGLVPGTLKKKGAGAIAIEMSLEETA